MPMLYVIHMTEWRIRLRAKTLRGVRSVARVSFDRSWGSQDERAMRARALDACSVRSRDEPVGRDSPQRPLGFGSQLLSVVIRTDSDWTSTQFVICSHLTASHCIRQRSLSTATQHERVGPAGVGHSLRVVPHLILSPLRPQMPGRLPLL